MYLSYLTNFIRISNTTKNTTGHLVAIVIVPSYANQVTATHLQIRHA